jgi:PIN domain nuclease of toxin-antitoxin system
LRLLQDTHTLLRYALDDPQLSGQAKALILDPANEVLISPASYWEIAIKVSIGKLALHKPYQDFMDVCLKQYVFRILPIEPRHTAVVAATPFHHKDPFDRMLIAQALAEGIPVVSTDGALDPYGITRLW